MNKKIIVEHHLFVRWVPELSTIAVYDGDDPNANDCFIEGTFWDDDLPRWMTQLLENIDPGFRIPVEGFVKFSTIETETSFQGERLTIFKVHSFKLVMLLCSLH